MSLFAPAAGPSRLRHAILATNARALSASARCDATPRKPMWARRSPFLPFIDKEGLYKKYAPRTQSLRRLRRPNHPHLHRGSSLIDLTIPRKKHGGRNNTGKVVVRGRGGEHKRRIRLVDTRRREEGPQDVVRIEFDPNRSGHIALLRNRISGMMSYILAADGLRAGDVVQSWPYGLNASKAVDAALATAGTATEAAAEAKESVLGTSEDTTMPSELTASLALSNLHANGNCLQLRDIPIGLPICNIALHPKQGGQLCRSAGSSGAIVAFESAPSTWAHVRLSSGEVRRIDKTCIATIGKVSNVTWSGYNRGKAGRSRWLGWRSKSGARAMNAVDHPMGGTGRSTRNKQPMSRTGHHAVGTKTRRPTSRKGNQQVVESRPTIKRYLPRRAQSGYTQHSRPSARILHPPESQGRSHS